MMRVVDISLGHVAPLGRPVDCVVVFNIEFLKVQEEQQLVRPLQESSLHPTHLSEFKYGY